MTNDWLWVAVPLAVIVTVATWLDVRTRRIPNLLTGPALLLGILVNGLLDGPGGAGTALLGAVVAGGLLFPGWMMGFMGAGDVKLMGAVGAWLAFPYSIVALVATMIAGGVLAVAVAARKGVLLESLKRTGWMLFWIGARAGRVAKGSHSGVRFPFAPAVLIGAAFALWRRL